MPAEKTECPIQVTIEDCRIIYRNFKGEGGPMNREGDRNFHVILDEDMAKQLMDCGWNVKFREPREEGDEGFYHLKVKVNYSSNRPPNIFLVDDESKTRLTEESVSILDWSEILNVDLELSAYEWSVNGNTGISAYLKTAYITIPTDYLGRKYNREDKVEEE